MTDLILAGKTALVTGATHGIGLVTARRLAELGADVVMHGRDPARLVKAASAVAASSGRPPETLVADFECLDDVRDAAGRFLDRHDTLDVLVNNAGLISGARRLTRDGNELTFQVDHLAHFLLTGLLLGSLESASAARVVTVSSGAHFAARRGIDFDDLTRAGDYRTFRVYAEAKLANVLFAYELARRVSGTGVTSNAVHPGTVRSGFGATGGAFGFGWGLFRPFLLTPEQGARTSVYVVASPEVEGISGAYFARSERRVSSPQSYDVDAAVRLWSVSEALVGRFGGVAGAGT